MNRHPSFHTVHLEQNKNDNAKGLQDAVSYDTGLCRCHRVLVSLLASNVADVVRYSGLPYINQILLHQTISQSISSFY